MKIDYTRYYRKWHPDTPEHHAAMQAFYRRLLTPHLPADRQTAILDVGCGSGLALQTLQALGYTRVQGVDADAGQVAAARGCGLAVELSTDSVAFLRTAAGRYDAVLALDVLEHIPVNQQLGFAAAMAEALRPDGALICTVPNANSAVAARWRYNDWTHHCSFTEHSLDLLLYSAGFADIRLQPIEFTERPRRPWWPRGGVRHWWAFCLFRAWRRIELMAELGPEQGRGIPLSLNLLGVARRSPAADRPPAANRDARR